MQKPRSDNKLLNMPEEHQAKLADWLLSGMPYHRARELVAKDFQVTVALSAFSAFWSAVCSDELLRRRSRAVNIASDVAREAERTPGRFDAATIDALKQKAFELAISPGADPKQVKAIFALVLKARDQELDQQQLKLDREKFEFDAAQEAMKHADAIKQIKADSNLTDEEKLRQVRLKLFGSLPE